MWINDPLNPRLATDPFGANSVCHTYGYMTPTWSLPDPAAPAGRLEELSVQSAAFSEGRRLRVYLPADFAEDRRYPLLIVHDGDDFVAHAGLTTVLDNLIHRGDIPPLVAALTQAGDRTTEYTGEPRHADFLTRDVLPLLQRRFPLREDRAGRVLVGASLGAVASLSTSWHHPEVYGGLVLLSGSFIVDRRLLRSRDPLFGKVADFVDELRGDPLRPPRRVFMSCGAHEGLVRQNRALARLLRRRGARGAVHRAARWPPLAELARPDAGRHCHGPCRHRPRPTTISHWPVGRAERAVGKDGPRRRPTRGRMPWPNITRTIGLSWVRISAGRSATRSSSAASTSGFPRAATCCASTSSG